jgi:transposase
MPSQLSYEARLRIVALHLYTHRSLPSIAHHMHCSVRTVQRVLYMQQHSRTVAPRPRSGRTLLATSEVRRCLRAALRGTPNASNEELIAYVFRRTGVRLSERTLQREKRRMTFRPVRELIQQQLTATHITKRLNFAVANRHTNWKLVMFSDEKIFYLRRTNNTFWVEAGQPVPRRQVKNYRASCMVWGCIWYQGRTEIAYTSAKQDSTRYCELLDEYLIPHIPSPRFRFMQDNAPCHKAANTISHLNEWGVPLLPDWPPYSPDMNPIEYCWSWMTRHVNRARPTSLPGLKIAIEHAWEEMPQATIQAYIDHVPRTLERIDAAGGHRL